MRPAERPLSRRSWLAQAHVLDAAPFPRDGTGASQQPWLEDSDLTLPTGPHPASVSLADLPRAGRAITASRTIRTDAAPSADEPIWRVSPKTSRVRTSVLKQRGAGGDDVEQLCIAAADCCLLDENSCLSDTASCVSASDTSLTSYSSQSWPSTSSPRSQPPPPNSPHVR